MITLTFTLPDLFAALALAFACGMLFMGAAISLDRAVRK